MNRTNSAAEIPTAAQPPPFSYADLFAFATQGSSTAFDTIVKKYRKYMTGFCRYLMDGNHHDGEDAGQEAWIRLWNECSSLGAVEYPNSLICTRAKWAVRSMRRHLGRQKRWGESAYHDEQTRRHLYGVQRRITKNGEPLETSVETDSRLESDHLERSWKMIDRLLTTLKPSDRELIEAHWYRGVSLLDLAAQAGVRPDCMRSRHHDALSRMRKAAHLIAIA